MNKELEEAKQNLIQQLEHTKTANECGLATKGEFNKDIKAIETVLQALDNSIYKEVIEKKKNQMLEDYKELMETNSTKAFIMKCQIEFAEELLEGK